MTIERNPNLYRELLLDTPQTFSGSWVDLGDEIEMIGFCALGIWLTVDIELGFDNLIRAVAKLDSGGANEYLLPIGTQSASDIAIEDHYFEFTDDVDRLYYLDVGTSGLIPYIQLQISIADGFKGVPSTATYCEITKIWNRRKTWV